MPVTFDSKSTLRTQQGFFSQSQFQRTSKHQGPVLHFDKGNLLKREWFGSWQFHLRCEDAYSTIYTWLTFRYEYTIFGAFCATSVGLEILWVGEKVWAKHKVMLLCLPISDINVQFLFQIIVTLCCILTLSFNTVRNKTMMISSCAHRKDGACQD